MGEDKKSQSKSQVAKQKQEAKRIAVILMASAILFMLGMVYLVHNDYIRLHPQSMQPSQLRDLPSRLQYAFRYQSLLVLWLLVTIFVTIYGRIVTKALNPLDEKTEHHVQLYKNILTNSFESIIISVLAQLTFVTFAEPAMILKLIPLVNFIQFIGRVTFFVGYPLKRSFGFQCTMVPNMLMVIYNMYQFGSFISLY